MMIALYRLDTKGRARYYTIHDRQASLFASHHFTVVWGLNFQRGQERLYSFSTRGEMETRLHELLAERRRDGYRVLYSYFGGNDRISLGPNLQEYLVG